MKHKLNELWAKAGSNTVLRRVTWPLRWLWGLLSHNFGLKILSLLMAILLWNYVVISNTSITREKVIDGLTGYVSGQTTLSGYGLAMLDDPAEALKDITVTVEVPQANYTRLSSSNIQVWLDLTSVRTAGTQEVALKASTSMGRVESIYPDSLTLTFETLDSRVVPVNVVVDSNDSKGYWYNVNRVNPSTITVSGAASVVRSIASASATVVMAGNQNGYTTSVPYTLLDTAGEEISQAMLNRSTSSVSATIGAYPLKEFTLSTDIANVVSGQPAEGYVVESVSIKPETISVAADGELLESLDSLLIEPVSVEGASQSFAARAKVSALSSFKYVSANQVYVNVTIAEESQSAWVEDVDVRFSGKGEGLSVTYRYDDLRVYVTGPGSVVDHLAAEGISASIDLSGLGAGSYDLPLAFDTERYPGVTFQPEMETLPITLTEFESVG
ncbi:MAG: hypothetical protein E7337_07275 [Clostridiales bacterium]|nr:hypothetical protein [Clostridiales bacterium]